MLNPRAAPPVTRAVTRPTVTVSLVKFNTSERGRASGTPAEERASTRRTQMRTWMRVAVAVAVLGATAATVAQATQFSAWVSAQKVDEIAGHSSELNTPFLDGCPAESPDGLSLYMASNRPGGQGSLDIWVARRASRDAPFGAPENLGAPVNSAADDFCPTPVRGGGLFFVSRRATAGSCGLGDVFFTRLNPVHGWSEPEHLACAPAGPNSELDEQGPSYVEAGGKETLYFSRSSPTVPGEIYVSERLGAGGFGPASLVAELSSAANDIQPNVRKDGRELVFSSNRSGSQGQDLWVSTREEVDDPWSPPANLGGVVNTEAAETRPFLSWDAGTLFFGRAPAPEGMSDIYVTTRSRLAGANG
jgi:WD40-like Beta Propeller Repeat